MNIIETRRPLAVPTIGVDAETTAVDESDRAAPDSRPVLAAFVGLGLVIEELSREYGNAEEALQVVTQLRQLGEQISATLDAQVLTAHRLGASHTAISRSLGVSKQAASKRVQKLSGHAPTAAPTAVRNAAPSKPSATQEPDYWIQIGRVRIASVVRTKPWPRKP